MTIGAHFRTSGAEIIQPTLAASAVMVPGGVGAWPAVWTQLVAALPTAYVLCGADVDWRFSGQPILLPTPQGQVQFGTGVAGFETIVAQGLWGTGILVIVQGTPDVLFLQKSDYMPFKPVLIPAGTRVAVRAMATVNVQFVAAYGVGYDPAAYDPLFPYYNGLPELYIKGLIGTRSNVYPDANFNICTSVVGWGVPIAWTVFINPTIVPTLIRGACATMAAPSVVGAQGQMEVAVGGAGSEVIVGRMSFPRPGTGAAGGISYLPRPYLVKPGERVTCRMYASSAFDWRVMLLVEEML